MQDLKFTNVKGGRIEGEIHISRYEDVICIYGDPTGLKNLAQKLESLSELNQEVLSSSQLPVGEGFHIHLKCECELPNGSQRLDIGRLDAKGTGDTTWYFTHHQK